MFIMAADNPLPDVIPMVTMPEDLIHLLTELHTVPVATTGPEGKPNIAAKSVMVLDPETIDPKFITSVVLKAD